LDEPPVSIEKTLPTRLILHVAQPVEQAGARGDGSVASAVRRCRMDCLTTLGAGQRKQNADFSTKANGVAERFFQLLGRGSRDFTSASNSDTSFTCSCKVGQSGSSTSKPG
jgi:hypothetical protein